MNEDDIKRRIKIISNELSELKNSLFLNRLTELINFKNTPLPGVSNIRFHMDQNSNEWRIEYDYSGEYNPDVYDYEYDESKPTINIETTVSFGKKNKYYITRNDSTLPLRIFRNSSKTLIVINSDYAISLDMDEQQNLIERYITSNIPEWLALKVFYALKYNGWDDEHIITYLSVV